MIDRLRVYIFASDGSLDAMRTYDVNADQLFGQKIAVPKDSSKKIYFVANEPATITSDLDDVTSAEELEAIEFTFAEAMNKGFNGAYGFPAKDFLIPMSATYSVRNAMSDINIYVGLTRAVARVDLYLSKGADAASRTVELDDLTMLSASGVTRETSLFESPLSAAASTESLDVASSDITLSTSTPQRVLSFYLAEREYDKISSPVVIEVDGLIEDGSRKESEESKSVTLGDAGTLSAIKRNHVYRINGLYNGSESEIVAKDLEIMDWVDVEVDGEIEGVMVAVDGEVAMDWLRNGNTYASKSISFGSNKAISFYLPVLVSDNGDINYEFVPFDFDNMSAGSTYDLKKDIALVNNYIFATTWIKSATITFTSPRSGHIDFVYEPVEVNYKIQRYPIRIKSDNVVKQMVAIYDNGYLPASLLSEHSADWAKRAPGGVIFAKRGGNHPLTTPEAIPRDDDGYYRGEHKVTAAEAANYCADTFGEGWYVPSHADMLVIAPLYDMLGVSYRFQNNGSAEDSGELTEARYWTSSASSSSAGWYWTADFMSRDYMIENLMELRDGSQSYFVRCVKDLQ